MRPNKTTFFSALVTASLTLPAAASFVLSANVSQAEQLLRTQKLELPETLGDWRRSHSSHDLVKQNEVRYEYCNPSQRHLFVIVQRGSTFSSVHDLHDCLVSTGGAPSCLRISNLEPDLNAGLIRTEITKPQRGETVHKGFTNAKHFLSLMWFQNSRESAPDRWSWRYALLKDAMHSQPIYHQVEVTIKESDKLAEDQSELSAVATLVHRELKI